MRHHEVSDQAVRCHHSSHEAQSPRSSALFKIQAYLIISFDKVQVWDWPCGWISRPLKNRTRPASTRILALAQRTRHCSSHWIVSAYTDPVCLFPFFQFLFYSLLSHTAKTFASRNVRFVAVLSLLFSFCRVLLLVYPPPPRHPPSVGTSE